MNPVILVGRRPDRGHRDRLWEYCRARWHSLLDWPIVTGFHGFEGKGEAWPLPDEPFCLSVASNRAAALASESEYTKDWDVALYVGADWIAYTGEQCEAAAGIALKKGMLVFAHDQTVVANEFETMRILAAADGGHGTVLIGDVHSNTFSGVLAVPRSLWEAVGGFDERFVGWGWDDLAFWSACSALAGGFDRVPGKIAHLWHPQDRSMREDSPTHGPNQVLGERYLAAKGNRQAMLEILAER